MSTQQFSNGASTTLNGAINSSQVTLVVSSTLGFPTVPQFDIIIDSEIMRVTGVAGATYTVTRASEATAGVQSAASHANGAAVKHMLTASGLTGYVLSPVSGALWSPTTLLTLSSVANSYGLSINGPAGAGTSFGLTVMAGTNASDYAARFQTDALVDILRLRGDGAVLLGPYTVSMPGGTLGFVEVSAIQATFTALTDLTSLTLTVTPGLGRRYRISCQVPLQSSTPTDTMAIAIREGATAIQGAQGNGSAGAGILTLEASKILIGDGAAHTYKLSAERTAGAGNVTMQAGVTVAGITYYAHLLIEDIGT